MTTIETSENVTLKVGDSLNSKVSFTLWNIVDIQGNGISLEKVIGRDTMSIPFNSLAYSWNIGLLEVTQDRVTYRKQYGSNSKLQI